MQKAREFVTPSPLARWRFAISGRDSDPGLDRVRDVRDLPASYRSRGAEWLGRARGARAQFAARTTRPL